ncbi:glycoside hydrolase family 72 protein [Hypoxylon trugodes]|uniref:glycoside hydrolase family 72 protein n=1 Tax=Hypoxylon trugodes TaxID=326681 RepID=UPI00219BBE16|nr:glycoside hydrolase family 72 protein [Hypoxylon trugodes]KAI1388997.1 glycoside hydrolase family 72 protein [Hypoxylon trugodes]
MGKIQTPITVRGRYFYVGDDRFLINGVVYQQRAYRPGRISDDPLSDDGLLELELSIPFMKVLGINTIYIPFVELNKNHDAAMKMLAEAGIYVILCIGHRNETSDARNRNPLRWYNRENIFYFLRVAEMMAKYINILGYVVPHCHDGHFTESAVAVVTRAIVRDIKRYTRLLTEKTGMRTIPVGIMVREVQTINPTVEPKFQYYCSGDVSETVDFFSFEDFDWVEKSYKKVDVGVAKLIKMFGKTHVPVFFAGYGTKPEAADARCIAETNALYSNPDMLRVFSGGIACDFFKEVGALRGLVTQEKDWEHGGILLESTTDYKRLWRSLQLHYLDQPPPKVLPGSASNMCRPDPPKEGDYCLPKLLPKTLVNWDMIEQNLDDSEWIDVNQDVIDQSIDDVISSIWESLNIEDIEP